MIGINTEDRVAFLRKQISTLEWDVRLVKDEEVMKAKMTHLNLLRSELQTLRGQSEKN